MGLKTAAIGTIAPEANAVHSLRRFEVHVLFTGIPSTLSALRTATQLSQGLGSRIRVLLFETVPYPLEIDEPRRSLPFLERRFRTVLSGDSVATADRSVETVAEIVLCRDAFEALCQRLSSGSVVVIGRQNRWWPSKEDRWAKRLRRAGHHVVATSTQAPLHLANMFVKGLAHA
jgi:hypothetical protein